MGESDCKLMVNPINYDPSQWDFFKISIHSI
jgi:hypothetical protein